MKCVVRGAGEVMILSSFLAQFFSGGKLSSGERGGTSFPQFPLLVCDVQYYFLRDDDDDTANKKRDSIS